MRHSQEFSRRSARAIPLLALVFGVLPLVTVVSVGWQQVSWSVGPGYEVLLDPGMIVPPLTVLAVVGYAWAQRHRPGRWAGPSVFVGLFAGGMWGPHVDVLPLEYATYQTPIAVVGGAIIANRLAAWARRILVKPLTPELADSPLELPVVARGCERATFYLGTEVLSVRVLRVRSDGQRHHDDRIPLAEITSARRVDLLGGEPLVAPRPENALIPAATAGPAVTVTAGSREWIIPLDGGDVDAAVAILRRRVTRETTTVR
ncbi:hypothetical protein FHX42_000784 [Saccharopolyspora lacisalsi]|uniref:Uncharacterized protein n=1 Tax=Halosaccharopolyspora lacisalsi TaxID=1000566 RepID=A0A839DVX0_9PSEU|nr:hypothetical protein [Halosaccharopolyspora lacisalsi]MBA8823455.1 hypothetical protein [Halosaccharopolyspora lacisalsi]